MAEQQTIKILVVDDEKLIRDFLARLLKLQHIQTKEAEDGFKAIEAVKREDFDMVFIDVRMPGIDGLQTFRELKKINPAPKYVMMTGYAVDDLLAQAKEEGVVSVLKKPFDINEIIAILKFAQDKYPQRAISILIVDDDDNILIFFKTLLKVKIYNISTAKTENAAFEQIKQKKFDLVFLDIVLKNANGMELYQKLRQIQPDLDIILITGYPEKAKQLQTQTEIVGCLYKPFEIDKIMSEIEKVRTSKGL
jgi:DNA-binding NtrC family response regulator